METIQDIPKLYTALAEWLSCLLFVLLLRRRYSAGITAAIMAALLAVLCVLQELIGIGPLALWIPGMALALLIMYGAIVLCCAVPLADAGFYWAIAFSAAEFTASLEWQLYSFFSQGREDGVLLQALFLLVIYGGAYFLLFRMERGRLSQEQDLNVSLKEMLSAAMITVGAFLISNISYVNTNTPLSGRMSAEIFYIRTLVALAGMIMLIALQERWQELQMKQDYDAIQAVLQLQYEQYRQSRESIEMINRKYHDLKHQIGIIRMEQDADRREEYLSQLEDGVQGYELVNNTGNPILDTILSAKQLYCQQHKLNMTVVADGKSLSALEVMDICSIFGNALDNAIESVEKLPDPEKRLINVAVYTKGGLLMIRVENYFETELQPVSGGFRTTKRDKENHGYGIRSIRYVAEKYGGSLDISTENHWFSLKVLIPTDQGGRQS